MLRRVILAVVVAIITTLLCMLVGELLKSVDVTAAVIVGGFLASYAGALGVLAGLWYYFFGGNSVLPA